MAHAMATSLDADLSHSMSMKVDITSFTIYCGSNVYIQITIYMYLTRSIGNEFFKSNAISSIKAFSSTFYNSTNQKTLLENQKSAKFQRQNIELY